MTIKDSLGNALTGAEPASLPAYETALNQLRCYIGDPVASVDQALAASPRFVMAHALRAYLHLLGTEPDALPVARAAHEAARKLPANGRERGHVEAIGHLVAGRWHDAGRVLEVQEELGSLDAYVWSFVGGEPLVGRWRSVSEIPAQTELSRALSKDLKKRGFRFVGPTVCYAFMQTVGLVNDHTVDCYRFRELAA